MAFGTPTQNASSWASATLAHSASGAQLSFEWDQAALKRVYAKLQRLTKGHNRLLTAAIRSGLRITSKEIKRGIPAYTTKAVARQRRAHPRRNYSNTSKMREAKKAVGTLARVSKGGRGSVPKGQVEGKVGSNVGMKRRTPRDRPPTGSVGIGRGNLMWYLLGTKPRMTDTTGVYTGKMRKTMVISHAWLVTKSQVVNKVKTSLTAGIAREAAKP